MKSKVILLFILLSMMLLLTSCGGQGRFQGGPETQDFFTGTKGLEVELSDRAPPEEVFEGAEFDIGFFAANRGAFDLAQGEDGNYRAMVDFKVIPEEALQPVALQQGEYTHPEHIRLFGKSYYFPQGEKEYFAIERFKAKPIEGNFETRPVELFFSFCYPYKTDFATELCVDTDIMDNNLRDEVCEQQDLSFSRGQGAPIAVTAIESTMVPKGVYVQPQFTLHIANKGDGLVSAPLYEDIQGAIGCGEVTQETVNRVEADVFLADQKLTCLPEEIILRDGKAEIECQLDQQSILQTQSNYMASLTAEFTYLYKEQYMRDITIQRSASSVFESMSSQDKSDWDCYPWEQYDATTQTCMDRCSYCAQHPSSPDCAVYDESLRGQKKEFSSQHACTYTSQQACNDAGNACIQQGNLCPPYTYCGVAQCLISQEYNAQPYISFDSRTPETQYRWYCSDNDDVVDQQRLCGCDRYSYYAFRKIDDPLSCEEIPTSEFFEVEGEYDSARAQMRYSFDAGLLDEHANEFALCLRVFDKAGAQTTRTIEYPFIG